MLDPLLGTHNSAMSKTHSKSYKQEEAKMVHSKIKEI